MNQFNNYFFLGQRTQRESSSISANRRMQVSKEFELKSYKYSTINSNGNLSNLIKKPAVSRDTLQSKVAPKIRLNQLSHYITIITLGFYFIVTTIPFGIILSLQNNITLKLNYLHLDKEDYLNDPLWLQYGRMRDNSSLCKLFFISNHCINFFFYLFFNPMFRNTMFDIIISVKTFLKSIWSKLKFILCIDRIKGMFCTEIVVVRV